MKSKSKPYFVYLLKCKDKTIYTGIAKDLSARILLHKSGKGAKYVRSRGASKLIYFETYKSRSKALKREWAIKKLPRASKLALAKSKKRL